MGGRENQTFMQMRFVYALILIGCGLSQSEWEQRDIRRPKSWGRIDKHGVQRAQEGLRFGLE